MKSLRKHAFGSPRKGGGQEDQLADPEHQGELLQLLKARRPLILRPSPAPQLIAANSSTHSKGRHAASGPGVVVSGQACRDSFGIQTAILPIMLSDNATPGATDAAAVRPQPCLASWKPVFAGVTSCGAPVMDASMRVSPGSADCGAQKERGTLLRCAVGTLSRRPASLHLIDRSPISRALLFTRAPLAYIASLVTKVCFTPWILPPTTLMGAVRTLRGRLSGLPTPGQLTIHIR